VNITEVRIKLLPVRQAFEDRLRAFCTVTFDNAFVVRDLKIIEGTSGFFIAMPSRKLGARCSRCGCKNHMRSRYCNDCGAHLKPRPLTEQNRLRFHADIAHPINANMRQRMEQDIVDAYKAEVERAKQPGYRPHTFPDLDYDEPAADAVQHP